MMNRKNLIVVLAIALVLTSCSVTNTEVTPVVITGNGLLPELSIDDKISEAEIIAIGQVEDVLPSKWKRQNEKDVKDATPEEIYDAEGLFTDLIISIDQIFKGEYDEAKIRVRSFMGKTEQVEYVNSLEPVYEKGKTYLIFLETDIGPTSMVDPGDYISVNAFTTVYEIVGDKAISGDGDEWVLEDLIAYIEHPFSTNVPTNGPGFILSNDIPNTHVVKEIIDTIERAYDIEVEAAYTFDLSKFPTVFINAPRFPVSPGTLETVRQLTLNPALESAGWLDYKMAFYSWRRDSTLFSEAVQVKAKAENRDLTEEERKSLRDPWGRTAPARSESPIRSIAINYLTIEINNDTATVTLRRGIYHSELKLVLVDGRWYFAKERFLSVSP